MKWQIYHVELFSAFDENPIQFLHQKCCLCHVWSEEQKGILNLLTRKKWSKALEIGSFGKLLENKELKERTRAKWAKGNGFFNTALETESPFCVSGMIKSKQGKSCSFWVLSLTCRQQHSKCSCSVEVPYTDPRDFQTYQTTWIWWLFLIWSAHTM